MDSALLRDVSFTLQRFFLHHNWGLLEWFYEIPSLKPTAKAPARFPPIQKETKLVSQLHPFSGVKC